MLANNQSQVVGGINMSNLSAYALTFVSKDRPGIVADVTKILFENGFNIADSSSTLLKGVFSMILLVEHSKTVDLQKIEALFAEARLNVSAYEIPGNQNAEPTQTDKFIISVYGADKPGIVYHIAAKLYEQSINIVDLQTQVTGETSKEAYIMILEVALPAEVDKEWIRNLKETADGIGTDITIRRLETYEL